MNDHQAVFQGIPTRVCEIVAGDLLVVPGQGLTMDRVSLVLHVEQDPDNDEHVNLDITEDVAGPASVGNFRDRRLNFDSIAPLIKLVRVDTDAY